MSEEIISSLHKRFYSDYKCWVKYIIKCIKIHATHIMFPFIAESFFKRASAFNDVTAPNFGIFIYPVGFNQVIVNT